jgi:hypothetical protein
MFRRIREKIKRERERETNRLTNAITENIDVKMLSKKVSECNETPADPAYKSWVQNLNIN